MKNILKGFIYSFFLAATVGTALAQTKEVQVTATIPAKLFIGEINPVLLDLKDKDVNKNVYFTVSENIGTVKVLISGNNGAGDDGSFLLRKGSDTIQFNLSYHAGRGKLYKVRNGVEQELKNNGENHTILFQVAKSDWESKPAGKYNETLTLTMSHE